MQPPKENGEVRLRSSGPLPQGVRLHPLVMHRDPRGCLTEIFRTEWGLGLAPVQWNFVTSGADVLRGVHVHVRHADYLILASGRATIGLRDLRPSAASFGQVATLEVRGDDLQALIIPPGVAHGFYFPEPAIHIYAVTEYWNEADELGCHWADPDLAIPWPATNTLTSPRDRNAQSFRALEAELAAVGAYDHWARLAAVSS